MSDPDSSNSQQDDLLAALERREVALERVSEVIADTDRSFIDQVDALLEIGREAVGTKYATFSFVDDETYVFEALDVPEDADIRPGDAVPFAELPNCRHVVETEQTLVLRDVEAEAPELVDSTWGIACYLGAPVFNGDGVYGTFCFYGMEPREEVFSDWDATFVELLSNWVGTQLQQRERYQSLRDTQLQLEAAVDAGAVGTWEWDIPENQFVTGPSFARTFGVDPDEASEGVPIEELLASIHEEDRDRVRRKIEDAIESCGEYDAEYRVWNADDDLRWVIARGYVECDDEGNPLTFPGALIDITELKRTEQQLEATNERLRASNDRLEQFAYAASHDLQEPLRMVSSYLQLLEDRYGDELDEDAEEFLEFAVDGADRMREMIEGLLEYSRVETRGEPLEPVELNGVLADVRADLQRQIEENDAEITVEGLPVVEGDPNQLRQVFQDLLENAITYRGEAPPRIHVAAEHDGDQWVISVEDGGIGIATDEHERIFEVFQRLHSRDEYSGTGIGLALCERIVERHGGSIWVDSEPGEGTTVSFTVPAAE